MSTDELGDRADRAIYTEPADRSLEAEEPAPKRDWITEVADWPLTEIMDWSAVAALTYMALAVGAKFLARAVRG